MKKLILSVVLGLAFTISANAQDEKVSGSEKTKKEVYELKDFLDLNDGLTNDLFTLLEMKREVLENLDASDERRKEMVSVVGLKIQASLDAKQLEKLLSNKKLYNKFIVGETTNETKK